MATYKSLTHGDIKQSQKTSIVINYDKYEVPSTDGRLVCGGCYQHCCTHVGYGQDEF